MAGIIDMIKWILIMQFFYAFAISMIAHSLPADSLTYPERFSFEGQDSLVDDVDNTVKGGLDESRNIPVIDLGALVFYSGNILIDILLNFVTAIPQMFALLIYGFTQMVGIDPQIVHIVQFYMFALVTALYLISVVQALIGIRAGRQIV